MKVKVYSPARPLADVEASSVLLPASQGMMEVLVDHAPMVAELDCGQLRVRKANGDVLKFFISGGYVDVVKNEVKVLVDVAESPEEIDRPRAESALKRAGDRLLDIKQVNLDLARARYAQKRALARLELLKETQP